MTSSIRRNIEITGLINTWGATILNKPQNELAKLIIILHPRLNSNQIFMKQFSFFL